MSDEFSDLEMWILEYLTHKDHCGMNHVTIRTVIHKAPKDLLEGLNEIKIDETIQNLYKRGLVKPGGTEISAEYYKPLETFLLSDKGMRLYSQLKG